MPPSLWEGRRWLVAGWLLALSSGFGQTFFVSIFAGHIQQDLGLSSGLFGSLYSGGTLASAALLMWAGRVADRERLRGLAMLVIVALAGAAVGMSLVGHAAVLFLLFFSLRFLGQGMMSHLSMTGVGRWFPRNRGKAISIAALGYPAAEASLPLLAVTLIALVGWRETWMIGAGFLLLVSLPAIFLLLRVEPAEPSTMSVSPGAPTGAPPAEIRQWTRAEVLRDGLFYALQPGILAPPFVLTALFFSQVPLTAAKGWDLSWFAASFPVYAAVTVISSLSAGVVVDRYGARRILPFYLVPLALAVALVVVAEDPRLLPLALGIAGMTAGGANTLLGALWAELYGTRHLGAVRGLATSGLVFASALSPALVGLLLDAGISVVTTLTGLAAYVAAAAALMAVVARRMRPS